MLPLERLDCDRLRSVRFLLSDIDDTITTEGYLTPAAYTALERLGQAGISVVAVTGRPAGWCDHIARMWPVAGVIGENGAFFFRYDRQERSMQQRYWVDEPLRSKNRHRLDALGQRILHAVPGSALASDQPYRIADLAIDYCEDVPRLTERAVDEIVALFREEGAEAMVSSIHVNGWFGTYNKLSMARLVLSNELNCPSAHQDEAVLFAGDSPNDEPMFGAFPLSVAVANVRSFVHRMTHPPQFVTGTSFGEGFVELAEHIIKTRALR